MQPIKRAKANRYNFAIAFFVALGSFTYGYNSAIIGTVIGQPSFYDYFGFQATTPYGSSIIGALNGLYAGAGVIGSLSVFTLLDVLGRRRAIQVAAIVCVITAALQAGSVHIAMFLTARFLNGLGVAWLNCSVPTYLSEISPALQRGRIVGAHGFILCSGYAVSNWSGLGTYYESNGTIQWRLLLSLQCVAPLILTLGSPLIPESPRWLINNGHDQKGLDVLERLHANDDDSHHVGAREEFVQIQTQLALDRLQKVRTFWQIMKVPSFRKRMFYGFWVQASAQSTGVLVISNYMVLMLNNLGLTGSQPLLLLAIYNSWAAFLNWVNSLIIDRFGRIKVIVTCLSGCVICIIFETALVAHYGGIDNTNKAGSGAAVFFIFAFVTFYGAGLDVSSYVYCSEIFPTNIRARGVGFSVAGLFLMTTIYTTAAGPAFVSIGWRFYIVFIVVTSAMLPLIMFKLPETKGLSLEEIGALFGDEVAVDITHLSVQERQELDERLARTIDMKDFDMKQVTEMEDIRMQTVDEK
ncbi:hypothetical protein B0A52_06780 [Exophiala mesophila]|uniref:Major facilitator superfamily (MFS) profile domain-containing protein n=1 Tax=Exophiala mesophila TaxID=212818 RepID=A0A438N035_EXOME|nr:hypothetical protein B0A52_06780 [Exophiala mesophila]